MKFLEQVVDWTTSPRTMPRLSMGLMKYTIPQKMTLWYQTVLVIHPSVERWYKVKHYDTLPKLKYHYL